MKRPQPVFLLRRPKRCRATLKKKGELGGVSEGKVEEAHYARRGTKRERGGEALPRWGAEVSGRRREKGVMPKLSSGGEKERSQCVRVIAEGGQVRDVGQRTATCVEWRSAVAVSLAMVCVEVGMKRRTNSVHWVHGPKR